MSSFSDRSWCIPVINLIQLILSGIHISVSALVNSPEVYGVGLTGRSKSELGELTNRSDKADTDMCMPESMN